MVSLLLWHIEKKTLEELKMTDPPLEELKPLEGEGAGGLWIAVAAISRGKEQRRATSITTEGHL
jgi:hypothetical protein